MYKKILFSTVLIFLSACSQEVPVAPPPTGATATAAEPEDCSTSSAVANGKRPIDDKVLSVTLTDKPVCSKNPTATATARWDVSSLNVAAVSIYVASPGNEKKLWVDGHATGEETTGKWVFANTCFTLQNKDTGAVLATRLVDVIPCTH